MDDLFDAVKDLKNITKSFDSAGKRNTKKTDFKLNKHCMHLIRGMLMGIEILQTGVVRTYRENDLPLALVNFKRGIYEGWTCNFGIL